jgi:small subunit ribosomal protein S8e
MAISQKKPKRKATGGRYRSFLSKKSRETGSDPTLTKMEVVRRKQLRLMGANKKVRLLSADMANVLDPKTKKCKVVKIKTVSDNSANRNYIRRNIITKGAIIDTEMGKAKVTSRPGQEGTMNAVLISE